MGASVVRQLVPGRAMREGAGVTVRRTLGSSALPNLDPFLMLDYFNSDDPNDYIAGFPEHPHRGFVTVTYMLDGHMLHQDSMGNRGDLGPGGVQWMKAASGVLHSEMPQQEAGLMRGFQIWINLPAREKMSAPAYQEFTAARLPTVRENGAEIKVIAGSHAGRTGPVSDPHTDACYLDVALAAEYRFAHRAEADHQGFVYCFEGGLTIDGTELPGHHLAVLDTSRLWSLTADKSGARFIMVTGRPLGEPVAQYGPLVMNTREEIEQALRDYRDGKLVRVKAGVIS
jgi:redox-sensitive bicupin YhaK (pirin superfamily)